MEQARRKGRSPNYPQWTLFHAIEKVRAVFAAEHYHRASRDVIAKDMGYQSLNGASLTAIAALRHYGLIQNEGDGLHVTDDAVSILELERGDNKRDKALVRVALAPVLFSEMFREFGDTLPSEANLRHWLLKRGFMSKATDEVIRIYRENFTLAGDAIQRYAGPDGQIVEDRRLTTPRRQVEAVDTQPADRIELGDSVSLSLKPAAGLSGASVHTFLWPLSKEITAEVRFSGPGELTASHFERLRKYLDLAKETWRDDNDPNP